MLVLGRPLLESFVDAGSVGAKTALLGVAGIETGQLGRLALGLVDRLASVSVPDWIGDVGKVGIVRAFSGRSPATVRPRCSKPTGRPTTRIWWQRSSPIAWAVWPSILR
jgi:hypothetical protein